MTRPRRIVLGCCVLLLTSCGSHAPRAVSTPSPTATVVSPPTSTTSVTPSPTPPPTPSPTLAPTLVAPTPTASPAGSSYVTRVPQPAGCLPVSAAIVGVKVHLVQRALGLVGHRERYDAATQAAVRQFQAAHHLRVDGVVGRRTWAALAIRESYCIDRYTAQPVVGPTASPRQRIEAMIRYARAQVGTPYIWGGAGPIGFDCSGLAIQAMYAGGRRVPGLDTHRHVQADFRSTVYLYRSSLPKVRLADRRRGDLVLYGYPITHLAIYLGGGRILESVRPRTREASLYADGLPARAWVLRPFPGRM